MTGNRKISISLLILLLILFSIRIVLGVYLWKKADGMFILLRGDDMSRVLMGYGGRDTAFFRLFINAFCPLSPWLYAQGLKLFLDVFIVPAVVNTVLGLGTILVLFFLSRAISGTDGLQGNMIGLLSVGLTIFYPSFVWGTLAGDRHLSLLFCVFVGILFWIAYIKRRKKILLLFSAIAFLFSTTAMHQGWIFSTIFALLVLKDIFLTYRRSRRVDFFLIGCILISFTFIFIHLYMDYCRLGTPLGFLKARHNTPGTSRFLYGRVTCYPPLLTKAFMFPFLQLFWHCTHMNNYPLIVEKVAFILFIGVLLGVVVRIRRAGRVAFNYALFVVYLLIVTVILAICGMGTVCCPLPRELIIDYFCFIPLFSIWIYQFIRRFISQKAWIQLVSISLIILLISSVNIMASMRPPKSQMRKEIIQLGACIKSLYSEGKINSMDKILLEQRVEAENFSLAIELHMLQIFAPERILFDREWKPILREDNVMICTTKDNPSLFEDSINRIQDYVREKKFRIVIVRTDEVRAKMERIMKHVVNIGEYHIYVWPEDEKLMKYIRVKSKQLPVPWLGRQIYEAPFG